MKLNELEGFPELGNTVVIDGIEYVKKREPLSDEEIYNRCCAMDSSYMCNFIDGVEWAEQMHGSLGEHYTITPLCTTPPKREPFGPEERQRLSKAYSTRAEQVAFEEGIIFAEISYGIGEDTAIGYARAELDLKHEPLSEDKLDALAEANITDEGIAGYYLGFRDAEKMHGIGGGE